MQPLDNFLPRLIPWVSGCPVPLAHQALVRSAAVFCDETNVIRSMVEPIDIIAGEPTYDVDLGMDLEVTRLMAAWLGTKQLALPTANNGVSPLTNYSPLGPTAELKAGEPIGVRSIYANTVTLMPPPDESVKSKLTLLVATRPKVSARQLDDALFDRWSEGIVAGAIGILASMPGQPFSDMNQATIADARFWRTVNRARIEARRGEVGTSMRVRNNPLV